jgi:hypothetical protein
MTTKTSLDLLREVVNLCAIGDIDENSDDGIGWAAFVRDAKQLLAQPVTAIDVLTAEIERLRRQLNTPELVDFTAGVVLEAQHQRERWGSDHDAGKTPADWHWLVAHLAGRALYHAHELEHLQRLKNPSQQLIDRHRQKAVHHCITAAAAIANWHAHMLGLTNMRPGIDAQHLGV